MITQEEVPSDPKMTLFFCSPRKDDDEDEEMDEHHLQEKSLAVEIDLHHEFFQGGSPDPLYGRLRSVKFAGELYYPARLAERQIRAGFCFRLRGLIYRWYDEGDKIKNHEQSK